MTADGGQRVIAARAEAKRSAHSSNANADGEITMSKDSKSTTCSNYSQSKTFSTSRRTTLMLVVGALTGTLSRSAWAGDGVGKEAMADPIRTAGAARDDDAEGTMSGMAAQLLDLKKLGPERRVQVSRTATMWPAMPMRSRRWCRNVSILCSWRTPFKVFPIGFDWRVPCARCSSHQAASLSSIGINVGARRPLYWANLADHGLN